MHTIKVVIQWFKRFHSFIQKYKNYAEKMWYLRLIAYVYQTRLFDHSNDVGVNASVSGQIECCLEITSSVWKCRWEIEHIT